MRKPRESEKSGREGLKPCTCPKRGNLHPSKKTSRTKTTKRDKRLSYPPPSRKQKGKMAWMEKGLERGKRESKYTRGARVHRRAVPEEEEEDYEQLKSKRRKTSAPGVDLQGRVGRDGLASSALPVETTPSRHRRMSP